MNYKKLFFRKVLFIVTIVITINGQAQNVAVTDDDGYSADESAMLDVKSTNKGLLIPRVALISNTSPIAADKPNGLLVWNTSTSGSFPNPGFYFWNGTTWERVGSSTVFENGLTNTSGNVGLGGSLTQNTTLTQGSYNLIINKNSTGYFKIADNSATAFYVNNSNYVGIGTDAPQHKLDVAGNVSIDGIWVEGNSSFKVYRNLASFSSASGTGAIVVNTKHPASAKSMIRIKIEGYIYGEENPFNMDLGFYWNGSSANNAGFINAGQYRPLVRVAVNPDGNLAVIIDKETAIINYPSLTVTQYMQGYDNLDEAFAQNWSIAKVSDLSAFTNISEIPDRTGIDLSDYYTQSEVDNLISGVEGDISDEDLWDRTGSYTLMKNVGDNVGIGTNSPESKLHVVGDAYYSSLMISPATTSSSGDAELILTEDHDNTFSMSWVFDGGYNKMFAYGKSGSNVYGPHISINRDDGRVGIGTGTNNPTSRLTVKGNTTGAIDDPLFEVKNNDGQTVFAVYNEGVRIFVKDDPQSKALGAKSGFAVGGYSSGKTFTNEYLRVTPDSVRVYIDTDNTKGAKSGFAVGGYSSGKTVAVDLMRLLKDNYFIGHESGLNTTGLYNLFLGYQSGKSNQDGANNVFIGYQAGLSNTGPVTVDWQGTNNVFIGTSAGYSNTIGWSNIFIGESAGYHSGEGANNIFIGEESGYNNSGGSRNVYIGKGTGSDNTSGSYNTYLGMLAGSNNSSGSSNILIGDGAGFNNTLGNNNVYIGRNSGLSNTSGSGNVFIGFQAGYNESGSNKLYIDNSTTASPLIYGNFSANQVNINGELGVNTTNPYSYFHVNHTNDAVLGDAETGVLMIGSGTGANLVMDENEIMARSSGTTATTLYLNREGGQINVGGTIFGSSDRRLKKDINDLDYGLDVLLKFRAVSFNWKKTENTTESLGFIAQEVEPLVKEIVNTNPEDGMKSINYDGVIPILVKAIQEQQAAINDLKQKISDKEQELETLKAEIERVNELEKQIERINQILKLEQVSK